MSRSAGGLSRTTRFGGHPSDQEEDRARLGTSFGGTPIIVEEVGKDGLETGRCCSFKVYCANEILLEISNPGKRFAVDTAKRYYKACT